MREIKSRCCGYATVKKGIEYKYKFANHARVKKKEKKQRSGFYDIRCESWAHYEHMCDSNWNCVKISSQQLVIFYFILEDPILNCKLCLRSIRKKLISCLNPRSVLSAVRLRWKSDLLHVTNGRCWSSHEEEKRLKKREETYKEKSEINSIKTVKKNNILQGTGRRSSWCVCFSRQIFPVFKS